MIDSTSKDDKLQNHKSTHSGGIRTLKNILKATVVVGLLYIISGCASMMPKPDFYPQEGDPHTLTYTDKTGKKNTVYDLTGDWKANYSTGEEIVRVEHIINQEGNSFTGIKITGNQNVVSGQQTIRGTVEGNLVRCEVYHSSKGWLGFPQNIERSGDSFRCFGNEGPRTYNRK